MTPCPQPFTNTCHIYVLFLSSSGAAVCTHTHAQAHAQKHGRWESDLKSACSHVYEKADPVFVAREFAAVLRALVEVQKVAVVARETPTFIIHSILYIAPVPPHARTPHTKALAHE